MKDYVAAFLGCTAAMAAVVVASIIFFGPGKLTMFVVVIALGHLLLLGVPAFLFLNKRNKISARSSSTAGFICGASPTAILLWPLWNPELQTTVSHRFGEEYIVTTIDGIPTLAGWIEYILVFSFMGAFGVVAGFCFWMVWSRTNAA